MRECLEVGPTFDPRIVRTRGGELLTVPPGWELLPPGDAALTRRVKDAGRSLQVVEARGRKKFSRGLWAPAENIRAARAALEAERSDPAHARAREAARARRGRAEDRYALEFANTVLGFLAFAPQWQGLARRMAVAVAEHATPVGSGTVARTRRIPVEARAEAAVIAWLRHQTTVYDRLALPRVKGLRREVRRALAEQSRALLDAHRIDRGHGASACPLCQALPDPVPAGS